jgi:hypothetical protein
VKKLVFIASLSHSGSTILDLILGGHSRFVGLGEIVRVLRPGPTGLEKNSETVMFMQQKNGSMYFLGQGGFPIGEKSKAKY